MNAGEFNDFVEDLLHGRRPTATGLRDDEINGVRIAIALYAARSRDTAPSEAFRSDLHRRLAVEFGDPTTEMGQAHV